MKGLIGKIVNKMYRYYYTSSSDRFLEYYRTGGGKNWKGNICFGPQEYTDRHVSS